MPRFYTFKSSDEEKRLLRVRVKTLDRARLAQKNRADRLEEENKVLQKEVEKLEEELEKVRKQRDTYKDMVFKSNVSFREQVRGRKRGGQAGHEGWGRKTPETIDQYQQCFLEECPDCQTPLKRTTTAVKHTVTDLPQWQQMVSVTTQYTIERQWCRKCHKEVRASVKNVVAGSRLG